MTDVDVDNHVVKLRELAEQTPIDEWTWRVSDDRKWAVIEHAGQLVAQCVDDDVAAFIAAAREAVPALLDEVERLTALLAEAKASAAKQLEYAAQMQEQVVMDTDEDRALNAGVVATLRQSAAAFLAAVSSRGDTDEL